ncbi:hypothetical protein DPX16_14611 [Anabarilius grahami]|uniref:Uncharacterized protein n=1 Tax=Anabarilius grahami TaxID=495550 RepID=A0A3N0YY70_ANAGA|nr:hypothetical protein DPX16_14611 [Anabarilius grahami]
MGLPKAKAFFKNEEELEVIYPTEVKSAKDKKKMKEIILRENPEILLSDYTGPEDNRVRCNLLFFTEHPSVWHTILCSAMTCRRKGGISKSRQLTLEGDNDTKMTVNLYHNGTVMVQGPETSLNEFQRNFKNLKLDVQKSKKDPELLNLNSHHSIQQLKQLCSAVRQLEEDNQKLRQELRRVREELVIREQHGHTLERLLEETRNQLHTKQHQQCVSTQTHSTSSPERVPNSTPHQKSVSTQPQSSFTPATRQSPQAPQSLKRKENSNITHAPPYIILHTGTNDLSARRVDVTKALSNVVKTASRIYPRAKVIISNLLPCRDVPHRIISTINAEIARVCAPMPNVHIADHQRITHKHLYDHIHIHQEGMRRFAKTIKESALKSPQKTS